MTAVSKFTKQWISPLYSSSCKQTVGWVLPMLWVGFVGLSFLSFLGVEAAQFAKSFVLFMCPKCTCMYACHTNFDLFASYLFQCGQDFILCQYSQRLQWKLFTILIYFPTSEGTDENPSKENSHSQILSLLCPLNEICRWSLYNLSCKNETSQEWALRTQKRDRNVSASGGVPGVRSLGINSHRTSHSRGETHGVSMSPVLGVGS